VILAIADHWYLCCVTLGKEKGQSIAIVRFWNNERNLLPQCFSPTKLILSANSLPKVTNEGYCHSRENTECIKIYVFRICFFAIKQTSQLILPNIDI
jgi:hypothetical protein